MQRIAIIDIGSNSARLVISHIYKSGAYNMVFNQKETLRLAQKTEGGLLSKEAFESTLQVMQSFAYMCKQYKTDKIIAVATAAIRNAKNGSQLTGEVFEKTGIRLHIISGNAEAALSYLGVINTLPMKDGIIFDLGGGSTELILFRDRKLVESVSIPLGAVNTTEIFHIRDTMPSTVYSDVNFFISTRMEKYPWLKDASLPLIGVGGTARTVAKMIQKRRNYPSSRIHNYIFSAQSFRALFKELQNTTLEERKQIPGLSEERADIILAGASIINCLLIQTHSKRIITSGCGLREGLFYDYYAKTNNVPLIAGDILEESTQNALRLFSVNIEHNRHVAALALSMFDGWHALHGLGKQCRKLLKTAALLHDIGITINYYSHARHSAYMILNAKIFGLTHAEQMLCAVIAGWHNGLSKRYFKNHAYRPLLTEKDWETAGKLALLLALAESLDYSESNTVTAIVPFLDHGSAILEIHATETASIELQQLKTHEAWFRETFGTPLKAAVQKEAGR
ncbi:MAG: Ppx/GppA family phosphatase [Acidaminococcaceae bacterium]|nr:Ppx/GppA family phosphatase [Acidaminococcaceae bacterium]